MLRERIKWGQVRRFTPEMYWLWQKAPLWETDSDQFNSPEEYESYWCQVIQSMTTTSKAAIGKWQMQGKTAARAIEQNQSAVTPVFASNAALAQEPLPFAQAMIQEKVALLSANPAMPMVEQKEESQASQVAGLNTMFGMVLDSVNWPNIAARAQYDVQFFNAGCFRWTVDKFSPGLFGDMGAIDLIKVDLDRIFPDPSCSDLNCKNMDYLIERHDMEIGEIQSQYPLAAARVNAYMDELISDTSVQSRNNEDYIQSPQPKLARNSAVHRQKIAVLEAWIRDTRLKFEPIILDGTSDDYTQRFKLDDEGYIIGNWVKRYPNGRLIVCTASTILYDDSNPFPHGQFPYVFPQGMPSSTPFAAGNAIRIMVVTRKLNDMVQAIHRYFQSEIPRPMMQDSGAIMDPNMQQNVPNDPEYILELAQGKRFERRPAMDIPASVYTYIQLLQAILDMTSGSAGVMRGQLEEGSQLSAEAMNNLQQFASSRLALEARFFNTAVKQLGYQLMWILRMIVKSNLKLTVQLPTGKTQTIDWESDRDVFERGDPNEIQMLRAREDYLVNIKAGTGSPGAKQSQIAYFQSLFNDNAIDRAAFLDGIEFPNRAAINERMRSDELENIAAMGFGKELGANIKEFLKQASPGRREKAA